MKNRNTKDVGENHIYLFILSNLTLFIGIFFSLNNADEAATPLFSIAINLFFNWSLFYLWKKKQLKRHSQHYNNLLISILCISALCPTLLILLPLLFLPEITISYLLLAGWLINIIFYYTLLLSYKWESKLEKTLLAYRINIETEKETAFIDVKKMINESDPKKFEEYIEKAQLFDKRMEKYLNSKLT